MEYFEFTHRILINSYWYNNLLYQITFDDPNNIYNYVQDIINVSNSVVAIPKTSAPTFVSDTGKYYYPLCDFFTYRDNRNEISYGLGATYTLCASNVLTVNCRIAQDFCHCKNK